MQNLVEMIGKQITPELVNSLSSMTGGTAAETQNALKSVVPALVGGLAKQGSSAGGAQQMLDLLGKQTGGADLLGNLAGVLGDPAASQKMLSTGGDLVNGIFGEIGERHRERHRLGCRDVEGEAEHPRCSRWSPSQAPRARQGDQGRRSERIRAVEPAGRPGGPCQGRRAQRADGCPRYQHHPCSARSTEGARSAARASSRNFGQRGRRRALRTSVVDEVSPQARRPEVHVFLFWSVDLGALLRRDCPRRFWNIKPRRSQATLDTLECRRPVPDRP